MKFSSVARAVAVMLAAFAVASGVCKLIATQMELVAAAAVQAAPLCGPNGCPGTDKLTVKQTLTVDPPPAPLIDPLDDAYGKARAADKALEVASKARSDAEAAFKGALKGETDAAEADNLAWVAFESIQTASGHTKGKSRPAAVSPAATLPAEKPPAPPAPPVAAKLPLTLLMIGTTNCQRCDQLRPIFNSVAGCTTQYLDIRTDTLPALKSPVTLLPTFIVMRDGVELKRSTDFFTADSLKAWIEAP